MAIDAPGSLCSFPPRRSSDLEAQRHAHRPRTEPPRPFGPQIDEAGVVELNLGRGQPVRIIGAVEGAIERSEEHTSELQSHCNLVCRLLREKKKKTQRNREAKK